MIYTLISAVTAAYILTLVLTGSSLLARLRMKIMAVTPWLQPVPDHPHFIECRLCVGFWVSLAATLAFGLPGQLFFVIYGVSYFMATQER